MAVTFEVERFEWAADDRLELEGRWFGLRGRRFIRPMLDVAVDGEPRRLLALMEHKPWAALDGEEWHAAFAWTGDRRDIEAQLAVGGDLTFELPRPGASGPAAPTQPGNGVVAERIRPAPDDRLERRLAEAERARAELRGEVQTLWRALGQKEHTVRELEEALTRVRGEAEAAVAARDAALAHGEQAQHEGSEEAGTLTAGEREAAEAIRARDEAQAASAEARAVASLARVERDGLRRELEAAIRERDAALARLDETSRALGVARAERPRVTGVAKLVRRRGPEALAWLHRERTRDEVLAMRFAALVALSVVFLLAGIWILATG